MPASRMPNTIVPIAAQRNQNRAAGVMNLPSAGFSSSGIFGIVGVATKLKYQSRPIHITPQMMCAQRMMKAQKASPYSRPPNDSRIAKTPSASTKPAITTLRRFPKKAAMATPPVMSPNPSLAHPAGFSALFLYGQGPGTADVEPHDHDHARHHHRGEEGGDDTHAQGHGKAPHRAGAQFEQDQGRDQM